MNRPDYLWAERDALVGALLQLTKATKTWEGRPDVVAELLRSAVAVTDAMESARKAAELCHVLPEGGAR